MCRPCGFWFPQQYCWGPCHYPSKEEEIERLKNYKSYLEREKERIEKRIKELLERRQGE